MLSATAIVNFGFTRFKTSRAYLQEQCRTHNSRSVHQHSTHLFFARKFITPKTDVAVIFTARVTAYEVTGMQSISPQTSTKAGLENKPPRTCQDSNCTISARRSPRGELRNFLIKLAMLWPELLKLTNLLAHFNAWLVKAEALTWSRIEATHRPQNAFSVCMCIIEWILLPLLEPNVRFLIHGLLPPPAASPE